MRAEAIRLYTRRYVGHSGIHRSDLVAGQGSNGDTHVALDGASGNIDRRVSKRQGRCRLGVNHSNIGCAAVFHRLVHMAVVSPHERGLLHAATNWNHSPHTHATGIAGLDVQLEGFATRFPVRHFKRQAAILRNGVLLAGAVDEQVGRPGRVDEAPYVHTMVHALAR